MQVQGSAVPTSPVTLPDALRSTTAAPAHKYVFIFSGGPALERGILHRCGLFENFLPPAVASASSVGSNDTKGWS
jgi:hypothetical protein